MERVNCKTTAVIVVSFFDESGIPVTPTQAFCSLFCETTQTVIVAETELGSLSTTKNIVITSDENKMQQIENDVETKLLTLRWTYSGGSRQATAEYRYTVWFESQV